MNTNNEECTLIPGQSNIKPSSISKSILQIYHQNIQGLKWKSDEVLDFFHPVFPRLMCVTKHHLNQYEIMQFYTDNYTLGAYYCRHSLTKGGVCIFVHNSLNFVVSDLEKFSNDQETEACTIRLLHNSYNICILTIYRAPTGNFTCFINLYSSCVLPCVLPP